MHLILDKDGIMLYSYIHLLCRSICLKQHIYPQQMVFFLNFYLICGIQRFVDQDREWGGLRFIVIHFYKDTEHELSPVLIVGIYSMLEMF